MCPSHHYAVYGLALHSNEPLPLPAVDAAASSAEIEVAFVRTDRQRPSNETRLVYALPLCNAAGESLLQIWQVADEAGYWVRSSIGEEWAEYHLAADGRRVEVMVRAAPPRADLALPLCGLVLPLLLRLHGVTCLHASAVVAAGGVVAFTGPAETGKSTTLAALLARGCTFFSDDLVPLHWVQDGIVTYGGFPQVGLWPDAMTALFGVDADLPYLWQDSPQRPDKRIYAPGAGSGGAATAAHPLFAVYLLGERHAGGGRVHIAGLSMREAVAQLVPHTTGRALASAADRATDLQRLAHLTRTVPVRLVTRPDDLDQLDAVARAITDDIAGLAAAAHSMGVGRGQA